MKIRLIITNDKEVIVTRNVSDYSRYFTYPEIESETFSSLQDLIHYQLDRFVDVDSVNSIELLDVMRSGNENVAYCKVTVKKLPNIKQYKSVRLNEIDHYLLPSSFRIKSW